MVRVSVLLLTTASIPVVITATTRKHCDYLVMFCRQYHHDSNKCSDDYGSQGYGTARKLAH